MILRKLTEMSMAGRTLLLAVVVLFALFAGGCRKDAKGSWRIASETSEMDVRSMETQTKDHEGAWSEGSANVRSEGSANAWSEGSANASAKEASDSLKAEAGKDRPSESTEPVLYGVYVCGAVQFPGVYMLPSGSRVIDAYEAAGGLRDDACTTWFNQADWVYDGQMLYVPTAEEAEGLLENGEGTSGDGRLAAGAGSYMTQAGQSPGTGQQSGAGQGTASGQASAYDAEGRLNLNLASKEDLMTLPGIGEVKADAILAWREEHGGFSAIEEIMQISGIKGGSFEKIRDRITVD